MKTSRTSRRRGVIILIVLCLLVLFGLVAVSFAIVAGQYLRSSRAANRVEQFGDSPNTLLDEALYQVLVGGERSDGYTTRSALCGHSLLRDLYGYSDAVSGTVTSASLVNSQLIDVNCTATFRGITGYYNGCVFTMKNGIAAGYSARVVSFTPAGTTAATTSGGTLRVEFMESDRSNVFTDLIDAQALTDAFKDKVFIVNGRPNNGPGWGYTTGSGNITDEGLLPNYSNTVFTTTLTNGDTDEGFDVPDYRDMWLSYFASGFTTSNQIIPSFHKPELIWYWQNRDSTKLNRACLRPLPTDNPNFSGSNPYLDPVNIADATVMAQRLAGVDSSGNPDPNCRWDVDNDRDGVYDSVWVDIGLPAKAGRNGRMYKPLAAILIRDLDGRLNLNAHGNTRQTTADLTGNATGTFAGGATSIAVARGHGYGPAEINLAGFLGSVGYSAAQVDTFFAMRYGSDGQPGLSSSERLPLFKTQGMPNDYPSTLAGWGSPPDVWGRGAEALDPDGNGQFFFEGRTIAAGPPKIDERENSPYESNSVRPNSNDTLFTYAEYERLLRPYDTDTLSLPTRMYGLTNISGSRANLEAVTPFSFDVPSVPSQFPPALRSQLSTYPNTSTILDLFTAKLLAGGVTYAGNGIANQLNVMVPLELQRGQRFNVNRLWGNGRDDNTNGTVDEPSEIASEQVFGASDGNAAQNADYKNDYTGPLPANSAYYDAGRQMYARFLYCLAMALVDDNYFISLNSADTDIGGTPSAAVKQELKARRLAQWAVNCVDYRDPDGIMTPFEYDVNPWNGWDVDGNLDTDATVAKPEVGAGITTQRPAERRVVWGMEYPDLKICETLATHDRRAADKAADTGGATDHARKKANNTPGDTTLDQYGVPQGGLFIELYCPRNPVVYDTAAAGVQRSVPPRELYTYATSGTQTLASLDLSRLSPATGATPPAGVTPNFTYPVWRIGVSEAHYNNADKSAMQLAATHPETTNFQPGEVNTQGELNMLNVNGVGGTSRTVALDRLIWFANLTPNSATPSTSPGRVYYNRFATAGTAYTLPGGSYAVVGPRAVTRFGGRTDNTPSAQRIVVQPAVTTILNMGNTDANAGVIKKAALGILAAANPSTTWSTTYTTLGVGTVAGAGNGVGISVSEPRPFDDSTTPVVKYYPAATTTMTNWNAGEGNGYTNPPDIPFDNPNANTASQPVAGDRVTTPLQGNAALRSTGTKQDYATAYLQRLANPLAAYDPVKNPYITVDWQSIDLTVFNGADRKPSAWDNNNPAGIGDWDSDDPAPGVPKFGTRQRTGNGAKNLWSIDVNTPADSVASPAPDDVNYFNYPLVQTLGYLNTGFGTGLTTPAAYLGSPSSPFPWFNWTNRPYNSPLELMLVPACQSSRACLEFSLANTTDNSYANGSGIVTTRAPFSHLLNFFQSKKPAGSSVAGYGTDYDADASELCRLFDFLETPSPFAGTERWFDPAALAVGTNGNQYLKAPFCTFPRFRDPGRVNLNTIADKRVLQAIVGLPDGTEMDNLWNAFGASRQGYTTSGGALDSAYPSRFAHPFCSAAAADLAATVNMRYKGVDATLLRPNPNNAAQPLFLGAASALDYNNSTRNPAFTYSRLTRLANLTTTRSNVFAVWVTIGYFEFDPSTGKLGREVGWDSGESRRNRAFFMIDRSIPVAYSPGEVNNTERCVVIRRYLE